MPNNLPPGVVCAGGSFHSMESREQAVGEALLTIYPAAVHMPSGNGLENNSICPHRTLDFLSPDIAAVFEMTFQFQPPGLSLLWAGQLAAIDMRGDIWLRISSAFFHRFQIHVSPYIMVSVSTAWLTLTVYSYRS